MILGFFFMLFLVLLFIFAIGSSIIRGLLSLLFGRTFHRHYGSNRGSGHAEQPRQSAQQSQQTTSSGGKKREKIFDKTDGEYVDFDEIKE